MTTLEKPLGSGWIKPSSILADEYKFDVSTIVMWQQRRADDAGLTWNALDANAIGTPTSLESHTISVGASEVHEGKPRAIAMDDLDWELLDEWPQESVHPQVPTIQTKGVISSVSWGQPSVTEIDDADIYLFDE